MAAEDDNQWRTPLFRENIIKKIDHTILSIFNGDNRINDKILNGNEMELKIYQKAKTKCEYMTYIAKLILYLKEKGKQNQCDSSSHNVSLANRKIDEKTSSSSSSSTTTTAAAAVNNNQSIKIQPQSSSYKTTDFGNNKRVEPTDLQKIQILKTAIETVTNTYRIQCAKYNNDNDNEDDNSMIINHNLKIFGNYIAFRLNQFEDEQTLLETQQSILSLLNRSGNMKKK